MLTHVFTAHTDSCPLFPSTLYYNLLSEHILTVHELIKILKSYHDKSAQVLVSSDPEGNNFLGLHEVTEGFVSQAGEIVHPDDVDEDEQVKSVLIVFPG